MGIFRNEYDLHRIGYKMQKRGVPFIPKVLSFIKRLVYPACDIPFTVEIGEGAFFPHRAIGVVIQGRAKIGKNAKIETNVCIGGIAGKGVPVIGNNVFIGTGATILGGVTIGNDCIIGAGAVVITDIPDGSVVVGVPGKIIKNVYKSDKKTMLNTTDLNCEK